MSIEKKFLKSRPVCKVKFSLACEACNTASSIHLVGDFNGWDTSATPLKQARNKSWSITLDLETGREYPFRYLIDGNEWVNDPEADKSVPNGMDSENSVLVL